jgi:tRNA pseudouridine38-40 synthase|tara:strand:+ start:1180 stop:2055 length:876 start_codon:yes stop_codon:yes gene_type:complete
MAEQVAIAFAIGYVGDAFHGSQIQPEIRTVQRDLEIAIKKAKFAGDEPKFKLASRTDAGVNARMNVGVCKISKDVWHSMGEARFRRAINDHLSDAVIWAATAAKPEFNPRIALRRIYRYRLECMREFNNDYDEEIVTEAMTHFEGTHDFTGFCRPEDGRETRRTVDWCKPWRIDGRLVGFEIAAQSFLWNQVRRIAWTLGSVAQDICSLDQINQSLESGEELPQFGMGSSRWLTLWEIEYDDVSFDDATKNLYSNITGPSKGLGERRFPLWQEASDLEQKRMLLESWIPSL